MRRAAVPLAVLALLALAAPAAAQSALPALTTSALPDGSQQWSLSLQTLVLLSGMAFLPAVLLAMTSFTRIVVVLGLLRTALGTPSAPPNQVMIGLALFLTFFIMAPVLDRIHETAWAPFSRDEISMEEFLSRGIKPLRSFMLEQTRTTDLERFAGMAKLEVVEDIAALPLSVLVPAFITSELKTAFQIGFTIFIPFLIIDMVVASVLMSLGMMMVPPATVALPFKLMLFVLADGWDLLIGALAQSFYV